MLKSIKDCCIGYGKIIGCILIAKLDDRNYHGIGYTKDTKELEYDKSLLLSLSTMCLLIVISLQINTTLLYSSNCITQSPVWRMQAELGLKMIPFNKIISFLKIELKLRKSR